LPKLVGPLIKGNVEEEHHQFKQILLGLIPIIIRKIGSSSKFYGENVKEMINDFRDVVCQHLHVLKFILVQLELLVETYPTPVELKKHFIKMTSSNKTTQKILEELFFDILSDLLTFIFRHINHTKEQILQSLPIQLDVDKHR